MDVYSVAELELTDYEYRHEALLELDQEHLPLRSYPYVQLL